jgi:hypothetical protein
MREMEKKVREDGPKKNLGIGGGDERRERRRERRKEKEKREEEREEKEREEKERRKRERKCQINRRWVGERKKKTK